MRKVCPISIPNITKAYRNSEGVAKLRHLKTVQRFTYDVIVPCRHGLAFIDQCQNRCTCTVSGQYQCTEKGCLNGTPGEPMACEVDGEIRVTAGWRLFCKRGIVRAESTILGGGGGDVPDIPVKRYCDGPCPADCGEELDAAAQCVRCRCLPDLEFGDVVVAVDQPCPSGLQQGPTLFATKICRGQGCTPGSGPWNALGGGCSLCICTQDGEPACTPCQRDPTPLTLTCDGGLPECPQDCGTKYNKIKDCFDCPCGVGEPGDTHVPFEEPCPPGTDFRESGAFFKACGPIDTLPKGDTKICDSLECPADCGTVRVSTQENCAYCQCGPELAPGDTAVPIYQQCPPDTLPGPTQLTTKVCRAPTREEYGDVQVCDSRLRGCPADCGTAGSDNYCQYCQCGPRLQEGDITVAIDEPCPPGFTTKEHQFATKTCSPVPGGGHEGRQYCSGPCPADCGEVLDAASGCYRCQCGPQLQFGDVQVAIDAPCPPGLAEGPSQFATKVCLGQAKGDVKVCGGKPCPADCGTVRFSSRENCVYCQCGLELAPGEEEVPVDEPCQPGLVEGPRHLATKVCRAPNREEYGDVQVCDSQLRGCPADCGTAGSDNYCQYCQCGPRLEEGDITVAIDEPCPPGFTTKEHQFATKTCSPVPGGGHEGRQFCSGPCPADCGEVLDAASGCYRCQCGPQLQFGDVQVAIDAPCPPGLAEGPSQFATKICLGQAKGDVKVCGGKPCPADCGTVRFSSRENCVYCQCGLELAPGEEEVPVDEPCQPGLVEGPRHLVTKVCRAPNREEYGDVQVCDSQLRGCPADCGTAGSDNYCQYCQCGPRLEEGDITVAIDEPCPPGFTTKEHQFATKTCSPADCGEVLDAASGCYRCQCGPQLQFGDVQVAIDAPCPPGLAEGPSQFATKVCLGQAKGDVKVCGGKPCPADCGTVRFSSRENCVYCQCGLELAPGEEEVPVDEPCQPGLVEGPRHLVTKVCRAPNREEYGDVQVCDSRLRGCPADCGTAGSDSYCQYCQCGPRLEEGDITVAIDEPCPPGFTTKEHQFATKTCSPVPDGGHEGRQYCSGPCPADCGEVLDAASGCYRCQCGPQLQFGDVQVAIDAPCPPGLAEGPSQFATKVCLGQGCQPGSEWSVHHDGCSRCVCTDSGEPACTPCKREPSSQIGCPQDCGKTYNAGRDCFECKCGVGEPGDTHVAFEEPCPPGTDFRESGAFFKACGPIDTLPKGDTKICDSLECPADCGTVRVSTQENCAYCQCGPELAPGDTAVPIYQQCPPDTLPGPTQLTTKVCRAPTREECIPGSEYNVGCDLCLCQEDGIPACTMRECSQSGSPEDGDSSQGGDNSSSEEDEDGEGQGYGKDESSSDENSSEERY
ncbi:hypothetical protein FJT64_000752 [Amphibalanus amphitrite]|uniref:Pacifastin domain-containing protein n=1 Tax=Amphibalanus amphitrite TaxID=1232801 RepID=A0A6A4VX04_AMPAM|nr:hypothetical protein FJT64_000752 [Amphibalanus amphitrite]